MISVQINTNTVRRTVSAELSDTVRSVFDSQELNLQGAMVNLDGMVLSATDLNSTFQALGVQNDKTVTLNSVVKADGGRN